MANGHLPAKHRTDGGGLALESGREVEQPREAGRVLRWKRRTRGRNSQFVGVSPAASWIQPWRRQRLVTPHGRRYSLLLEEQSLSDQKFYRRGRLPSSPVGDDRPRHED